MSSAAGRHGDRHGAPRDRGVTIYSIPPLKPKDGLNGTPGQISVSESVFYCSVGAGAAEIGGRPNVSGAGKV
jgi:hypothetical protein